MVETTDKIKAPMNTGINTESGGVEFGVGCGDFGTTVGLAWEEAGGTGLGTGG
jgi:hypothetical protein